MLPYYTGVKYILYICAFTLASYITGWVKIASIGLCVVVLLLCFFRNPIRKTLPVGPKQILSPADGVVIKIVQNAQLPKGYEDFEQGGWQQVSIFMGVHDVHINRAPISGKVVRKIHTLGSFKYAKADQADVDNERLSIAIEDGFLMICQQVAGMLARRIICHAKEGDHVQGGAIYGIIQLGSRADLFFPGSLKAQVKIGQKVRAGLDYIVS